MNAARNSLWLALTLLAGCQWLGIAEPQTFNQRLAVGYATVTTIRTTAETLLVAGKIQVEDAVTLQAQADTARSALDAVRVIGASNPQEADNRLDSILIGLNALNAYLQAREP